MILLDGLFRFSGIGFLAVLAFITWRDGGAWKCKPYLILACISVAALFLGYTIDVFRPPQPLFAIARFADIPHLVFVWLFALCLYDASFRLRFLHIVTGVLYCLPIVWLRLSEYSLASPLPPWMLVFGSLTSAALMLHLCYVVFRGRSDDLIDKRRRSRLYFILMIVCVAVSAAVIDPIPNDIAGLHKKTAKIIPIWLAIVWGLIWLTAFNQRAAHFGNLSGSGRKLENQDTELEAKLKDIMGGAEAFREAGLTIDSLSQRLGVTQHRLRALINQGLGHSNFSAYLNLYRIDAVKRYLQKPEFDHLPILTIAMDCGFNSLSTFNKAFKTMEGVTPSAYRKGLKS